MSEYNKVAIRFANRGINLTNTPESVGFGQWITLLNLVSLKEGELTTRYGTGSLVSASAGTSLGILGVQRINDSVNNRSTYICKGNDGSLYKSVDGSSIVTTTAPFTLTTMAGASGLSSVFGSFVIASPPLSSSVYCYVGDRNYNYKVGIQSGGTTTVKNMGITRMSTGSTPTFVQGSGGSLTALASYNYRWTLFDKNTGVESLHNSLEGTAVTLTGANRSIGITIPTLAVDPATTHVRVYRSGGTLSNLWLRLSDDSPTYAYTGTTISFTDSATDASIASSVVLNDISDRPFSITQVNGTVIPGQALPYLFGPYLGYILGVGDPLNPGYLYWTDKFSPDTQDPANNIEVSSPQDPLQNGVIYDGKPFIFSKEGLYTAYAGLNETSAFTPSKTSCGRGLWTPNAVAVGQQIYFLGKDGIYATSGGIETSLTDNSLRPLFDPDSSETAINGIGVVDYTQTGYMRMVCHKNEVWFNYYAKNGYVYILVYDTLQGRWTRFAYTEEIRSIYSDEQVLPNIIFGTSSGRLLQETGTSDVSGSTTANITSTLKTGLITMGAPLIHKEWGALILDVNPNGDTVQIYVYKDRGATLIDNGSGVTASTSASTRTRLFCNLQDTFSEDIQIEIVWNSTTTPPILYGYEILFRPDVTQLSRWSATGITHGLLGWQIPRSAYITLRSDGTTTLTITTHLDATTTSDSYSIASTAGVKKKIFVPFNPRKGKLFDYVLANNSATYFRLYSQESEVHVKPWISSMSYAAVNPFSGGQGEQAGGGGQMDAAMGGGGQNGGGGGNRGGNDLGGVFGSGGLMGIGAGPPPPNVEPPFNIGPNGEKYPGFPGDTGLPYGTRPNPNGGDDRWPLDPWDLNGPPDPGSIFHPADPRHPNHPNNPSNNWNPTSGGNE